MAPKQLYGCTRKKTCVNLNRIASKGQIKKRIKRTDILKEFRKGLKLILHLRKEGNIIEFYIYYIP